MTLLCTARCRPKTPRQAAPGLRLCQACLVRVTQALNELADLAADLEDALTRSSGAGEKVSGSHEQPLPLNVVAASVRFAIRNGLVTTVRIVIEERGLTTWPRDDIGAMAVWLREHSTWLAAHPDAGPIADDITSWPGAALKAIAPNPSRRVEIGPCVMQDCQGQPCPGILTAVVRPLDSVLPSQIVCSWWAAQDEIDPEDPAHCWTADQWHALAKRLQRRAA